MARKPAITSQQRRNALSSLYRRYRHRSNVTGFDVGFRWTGGKPTKGLSVRVHVTAKIPEDELSERELFPKEIEDVPVDVMVGPYQVRTELGTGSLDDSNAILSGTSCRRASGGAGTIGAVAIEEKSGRAGILSNWHVLTTYRGARGDLIYHAEFADRPIARLAQSMLSRHGDAAFAPFEGPQVWLPILRELNVNLSGARNSRLGEILCKYGRSTGLTHARVDGEGIYRIMQATGPGMWSAVEIEGFRLAPEDPGSAQTTEISAGGDSGACWVSANSGEVVGLHMAGEGAHQPDEEYALACNMPEVLHRLGLRLATLEDLVESGTLNAMAAPEFLANTAANTPQALASSPAPALPCPRCGRFVPSGLGFDSPSAIAEGTLAQALPTMSASGNIWQEFLASMHRRYPSLANEPIEIDHEIQRYFQSGDIAGLMRKIILRSPRFYDDRAIPSISSLRDELVFRGVCIAIRDEYQDLGYPTTL